MTPSSDASKKKLNRVIQLWWTSNCVQQGTLMKDPYVNEPKCNVCNDVIHLKHSNKHSLPSLPMAPVKPAGQTHVQLSSSRKLGLHVAFFIHGGELHGFCDRENIYSAKWCKLLKGWYSKRRLSISLWYPIFFNRRPQSKVVFRDPCVSMIKKE